MTIAAKLSRKLYETFGDEAAETMIDWMQDVDARRAELRELHDMTFDRFDARLEQRLVEFREALREEWRAEMRTEFEKVNLRFGKVDQSFVDLRTEIQAEFLKLGDRIDSRYADLFKLSFAFWIGSAVTLMLGMAAIMRMAK